MMTELLPDRQGYLGNLHEKTLLQLQELLHRQESLLKKEKFIKSLPDKGRKIHQFYDRLECLIKQREEKELASTDLREAFPRTLILKKESSFSNLRDKVQAQNCSPSDATAISPQSEAANEEEIADESTLIKSLQNIRVSPDEKLDIHLDEGIFLNSYERVIKKPHQNQSRSPFKPNRTLKVEKVEDLPPHIKALKPKSGKEESGMDKKVKMCISDSSEVLEDVLSGITGTGNQALSSYLPENSSAHSKAVTYNPDLYPSYHFQSAKLISIEESLELQCQQLLKQEEIRAQQAAARLASDFGIKMTPYEPKSLDMAYREARDLDSDDEEEEEYRESED